MAFRNLLYLVVIGGAMLCTSRPAAAQENSATTYDDLLRRYDYEVEVQTIAALNQILTPEGFAAQMDEFDFPLLPPARTIDEINEMIDAQVHRVVEEKYPTARKDEILREAEDKYRLYRKGDTVTIQVLQRGVQKRLTGTLYMITPDNVKLGDDIVPIVDVAQQDKAHFNREIREDAINTYVKINTRRFTEAREKFEAEQRAEITEFIFKKNGYYYLPSRGRWFPKKVVFEALYEKRRQELYAEKLPEVQAVVYESHDWLYDSESSRWVPPPELLDEKPVVVSSRPDTKMDQSKGLLRSIVQDVYAEPETAPEDDAPAGDLGIEGGGDLFGEEPATAPTAPREPAPPATAPQPDVSDLYDE